MCVCGYEPMNAGALGGQKYQVSLELELELQAVVNYLTRTLGTELWSAGGGVQTPDH